MKKYNTRVYGKILKQKPNKTLKGKQYLGKGYVFAPYIPLNVIVGNPKNGKSIMSRYTNVQVNKNYYTTVTV